MADNFIAQMAPPPEPAGKIKLGDEEYTPEELQAIVSASKKVESEPAAAPVVKSTIRGGPKPLGGNSPGGGSTGGKGGKGNVADLLPG